MADREGRLEDRPKRIKAELLAYDDCDIDELLNQLANRGFIVRYEANGVKCIQVINFKKHQKPHQNEVASDLPGLDEVSTTKATSACDLGATQSGLLPLTLTLNPIPLTPILGPVEEGAVIVKVEKVSNPKAQEPFDTTGPGLAQQWLSGRNGLRGRTPNKDEYLQKTGEFFEEMIGIGVPGQEILTAILAKRDRSEYLFKFKDRLLKAREPPRHGKKQTPDDAAAERRRLFAEQDRKAGKL